MAESPDPQIPSVEVALARLDMPLREAMMTQRAVRRLNPDPVDDEVIRACIELALRAPTGSNSQGWQFVVVRDRAIKERLARRYRQAWAVYGRLAERATAASPAARRSLAAAQWQVDHFEEVPVLVVPCLRSHRPRPPFTPQPFLEQTGAFGSIYPSVQNLLLAARAMGLGASLTTLPLWNLTSARRILSLPLTVTPYCVVPLGWPLGRYGPTTRRPVEKVVHLDRYGDRAWLDESDTGER